ncbi:MAG: hypothetical protein DMG60_05185 [Acidobacteria bacterium]|nr:MAG: hypothetical protein DMG60_05185 [Acidobacteriota bacterium]
MHPRDLTPEHFKSYAPEARNLATKYLLLLRRWPLSFLPSVLREIVEYDCKFPTEREALEKELEVLSSLAPEQLDSWLSGFAQIRLSTELEHSDWVNAPAQFVEQLSAHLWTTHQLDGFRSAAIAYADRLRAAAPSQPPQVPRLGISVIGKGVSSYDEPLFRKLRVHGAYFSRVNPENGLRTLLDAVAERAKAHRVAFAHWYIDGGEPADHDSALTFISYESLEPARANLLRKMRSEIDRPGMGPETLRTILARMQPADIGLGNSGNAILDRFQLKLLTEGSGTQIFSTTFTQWAAREALRRAQPLTLLARFAPRQRQRPMNELLSASRERAEPDVIGSLIDAEMGAYYNWLNQQRLPGTERSSFLVWFEGHSQAVAIGPSMPRATESNSATELKDLLSWMS